MGVRESYNAKNRKGPREENRARSDINAAKRSSFLSLSLFPCSSANPPPLTPLNAIPYLRQRKLPWNGHDVVAGVPSWTRRRDVRNGGGIVSVRKRSRGNVEVIT